MAEQGATGQRPKPPAGRPPKGAVQLIPAAKLNAIEQGMPDSRIRELLGAPDSVKDVSREGVRGEIWTYRVSMVESASQTPTGTQDVPYVDPFSGQEKMLKEPVYETEYHRVYQAVQFLFVQGQLIQRKPIVESERAFK